MVVLKQLIEAGVVRGIIDRTYPLTDISEAHRYVELGTKAGDVIVTMS
jgi:NADPH:quinone reductase-like Zn-dependent oxidoreductase